MKIRTVYFKVDDLPTASQFWQDFLELKPHKKSGHWHEFMIGETRLGLFENNGESISGSDCVPVFEFDDEEIMDQIERAKELGAIVIEDCLEEPSVQSILLEDPVGNEFELCKLHD